MRRSIAGAVLVVCALARPGVASAVTNGAPDDGDPAVVAIIDSRGEITCTGTIVAPHVVLTAAHCINPLVTHDAVVAFGASATAPSATIPIIAAKVHPAFDIDTFANDLALLAIASASPVAPMPLARGHAPAIGDDVSVVGYGAPAGGAQPDGPKRRGTSRVTAVAEATFDAAPSPSQPCEGDSGGPVIASVGGAFALVGVVSHGDEACTAHVACARLDAYLAGFLDAAIAAWSDASADVGARCLFPGQCRGGPSACVTPPDSQAARYCTAACDVNADCARGMICAAGNTCRYPVPTPGALGSACAVDDDCADGQCESGVCALRCAPGVSACPGSFVCANTSGIDFFCVAPASPSVTGGSCAMAHGDGRIAALVLPAIVAVAARRCRRAMKGRHPER